MSEVVIGPSPERSESTRLRRNTPSVNPLRLLPQSLVSPDSVRPLGLRAWQLLIEQAHSAGLLGKLACQLTKADAMRHAPEPAQRQLAAAMRSAKHDAQALRAELHTVRDLVQPLGVPVLLLRGAAYAAAGLVVGEGRVGDNIQLLVPRGSQALLHRVLSVKGWRLEDQAERHASHQVFTQELARARGLQRVPVLCIQSELLPLRAESKPDPSVLFDAGVPFGAEPSDLRVPSSGDLLAMAAADLYYGDYRFGLRDLFDIHQLVEEQAVEPRSLAQTLARADVLGLREPLAEALRGAHRVFGTPLPAAVLQGVGEQPRSPVGTRLRNVCLERLLVAPHPSTADRGTWLATAMARARGRWLRSRRPWVQMPWNR